MCSMNLPEIPVCVGYKIDGKTTDEIPPQDCGFKKIEPVFTKMPGWANRRSESPSMTSCRRKPRNTCASCRQETQAKIGMISTGPERNQIIWTDEFTKRNQATRRKL